MNSTLDDIVEKNSDRLKSNTNTAKSTTYVFEEFIGPNSTLSNQSIEAKTNATASNFQENIQKNPKRVVPFNSPEKPLNIGRYQSIEMLEGYILEVQENSFWAKVYETRRSNKVLEAEFAIEDIPENRRDRLVVGAPIVWHIGKRYFGSKTESVDSIWVDKTEAVSLESIIGHNNA